MDEEKSLILKIHNLLEHLQYDDPNAYAGKEPETWAELIAECNKYPLFTYGQNYYINKIGEYFQRSADNNKKETA